MLSVRADDNIKGMWSETVYTATILSSADEVKATWVIIERQHGKPNHGADNADDLLRHFFREPLKRRQQGIFIHSETYAIPDTPEERQWRSTQGYKLYYNPIWRKSENELVAALIIACKKKGIPLYVNMSSNVRGNWKILNMPKDKEKATK